MISQKQQMLKDVFEKPFEMNSFVNFINEFFNGANILNPNSYSEKIWAQFANYIHSFSQVANYNDGESDILILTVKLNYGKTVDKGRSVQRGFISKILTNTNYKAAIVAFYNENEPTWRLSFIEVDYELVGGKVRDKTTPVKRYSYLVGKGEPSRTAQDRLYPIFKNENFNPNLKEIKEAFSVDAVTVEFFKQYKKKYIDLKEMLNNNQTFLEISECGNFTSEQFAKKLMGQLAFLYFLQKKGWLGVKVVPHLLTQKEYNDAFYRRTDKLSREIIPKAYLKVEEGNYKLQTNLLKSDLFSNNEADILASCFKAEPWGSGENLFIRKLFNTCIAKKDKNFFDEYLEPLFYSALNTKRGKNHYFKIFNCKIPFLNGGLFEPLDGYNEVWQYTSFNIPNDFFSNKIEKGEYEANGLLDIFENYNFTMNEDEPLEKEVAVDPEMLGKIFENLLEVKDRKSKGAFYTPREIVHYMCQESLVNYLVTNLSLPYDDVKDFILYGEIMKDLDCSAEVQQGTGERIIPDIIYNNLMRIDRALETITVADPAVGSGAFPLGMLNEIVRARTTITEYVVNQIPKEKKFERLQFRNRRNAYNIKWNTIQHSIFAVDIEASAVDIAKLRLWLSLVVEQEIIQDSQDPFYTEETKDPHPLPNLDYNIMCGNSLIDEFEGIKLFDESLLVSKVYVSESNEQTGFFNEQSVQISLFDDIVQVHLEELFKAQERLFGEDDTVKKQQLKKKIEDITKDLILAKLDRDGNEEGKAKYLESLKQKTRPYFVWQLEFAKVFKEKGGFDVVIGNPPYFNVQTMGAKNPFIDFLKNEYSEIWMDKSDILFYFIYLGYKISNFQVNFITSNAYLFSDKAQKFRNFIVEKMHISKIINFENYMVFDTASITSCITFFTKNKITPTKAKVMKDNSIVLIDALYNDKLFFDVVLNKNVGFALIPYNIKKLNDKIINDKLKLGDILKVGKGMETAANEVYCFNEIPNFPKEYLRQRITGDMISKYYINNSIEYLLYYEFVESFEDLDESVKKHLLANKIMLSDRATVKNEGRDWWRYSRPMHKEYYQYDKLWCSYRGKNNCFSYDNTGKYIGLTNMVAIFDTNPEYNIKYILALLNSKLLEYNHKNNSKQTGGGIYEYVPNAVSRLPLYKLKINKQQPFVALVNKILEVKKSNPDSDTTALEAQIDQMVYELYGLTEEEIKIVEESAK